MGMSALRGKADMPIMAQSDAFMSTRPKQAPCRACLADILLARVLTQSKQRLVIAPRGV